MASFPNASTTMTICANVYTKKAIKFLLDTENLYAFAVSLHHHSFGKKASKKSLTLMTKGKIGRLRVTYKLGCIAT